MHEYDKSSKWLIQHHGDSILRLAGILDIVDWRPLQAELVQPRRLPDGLIEVHRQGRAEASLFVLATRPSRLELDRAEIQRLVGPAAGNIGHGDLPANTS